MDESDDFESDEVEVPAEPPRGPDIKILRQSHKELPKEREARLAAESRADKAERKLLILETPGLQRDHKLFGKFTDSLSGINVDDLTPERIRQEAVEWDLASDVEDDDEQQQVADEARAQSRVAAMNRNGSSGAAAGQVTPQDLASATPAVRDAFRKNHPDAYQTVKHGGTVKGITL